MPATVLKILVQPGAAVDRGETLIILEAMKMELPLRAPEAGIVEAVHCRVGELVQPEAILVELR
jgi:3-methylcrotonyl-CoA carboxylase alpha subunit